jgi:fatty acid synthase subunit alpha, fungi type
MPGYLARIIRLLSLLLSATALQSVEIACDTILSGKAKVMIAGGFDDFSEEGSFEFANMGATSNSLTEFAMGREPNKHSRPTSSTRDGV